jgi:hypothetical protein
MSGCPDGQSANSIIVDAGGDLVGATNQGGAHGGGVIFRVVP